MIFQNRSIGPKLPQAPSLRRKPYDRANMTRINHSKPTMHRFGCNPWMILLSVGSHPSGRLGRPEPAVPVFKDGEAQIVERFADPDMWIRHDLWVETSFDSDGDGRMDRMHVDVTRPRQTETEALKLPVIYAQPLLCRNNGSRYRVFLGSTSGIESGPSRTPSRSSGGAPR